MLRKEKGTKKGAKIKWNVRKRRDMQQGKKESQKSEGAQKLGLYHR